MWLSTPNLCWQNSTPKFWQHLHLLSEPQARKPSRRDNMFRVQWEESHRSPRRYKTTHLDPHAQAPENAACAWILLEGELGACGVERTTSGLH